MPRFSLRYFYLTIILFFIEVGIAIFFNDQFVRNFVGDVLVVILIYCFVKTFWNPRTTVAIGAIFAFACLVELLQYFNFVDRLGLPRGQLLATIIGTTFDWKDILAYALGSMITLWGENKFRFSRPRNIN
jgi:hypothetical protein